MGVSHADDIQYLFFSPDYLLETPEEFAVKDRGSALGFPTLGNPRDFGNF